jgi:hypothetical protein
MSKVVRNEVISIDVGNKLVDIIRDGSKKVIIVPTVILPKRDGLKIESKIFTSIVKDDKKEILAELVDADGKKSELLYLGASAVKHGGEERAIKKDKYNDLSIAKAIHIMTAYAILKDHKSTDEAYIKLVTSLPLREFTHSERVEKFKSIIAGEKTIKMHGGSLSGSKLDLRIQEEDIMVLPEGAVALYNIITTKEGKLKKEYEDHEGRVFIVIDIGGGTVDIMAVTLNLTEDGVLLLEPEGDLIGYMDEGILTAEQDVVDLLFNEMDYC